MIGMNNNMMGMNNNMMMGMNNNMMGMNNNMMMGMNNNMPNMTDQYMYLIKLRESMTKKKKYEEEIEKLKKKIRKKDLEIMDLNKKLFMNFQFNNQNQNFFNYILYMNQLLQMMEINIMKMNQIDSNNNDNFFFKQYYNEGLSVIFRATGFDGNRAPIMIQCLDSEKILGVVQNIVANQVIQTKQKFLFLMEKN